MNNRLIVASSNKHKVTEIKNKFQEFENLIIEPMNVLGDIPEIEETGNTFAENSLIKAASISELCDCFVLADDSGLQVDALNGEPGIYSARYGNVKTDKDRYTLLLKNLEGVPTNSRTAHFVCAMTLILPGQKPYICEGRCSGIITETPSGQNGFGYDPIFYLEEYGKTMAEIPLSEKNKISHRAKALDNIYKYIKKFL